MEKSWNKVESQFLGAPGIVPTSPFPPPIQSIFLKSTHNMLKSISIETIVNVCISLSIYELMVKNFSSDLSYMYICGRLGDVNLYYIVVLH